MLDASKQIINHVVVCFSLTLRVKSKNGIEECQATGVEMNDHKFTTSSKKIMSFYLPFSVLLEENSHPSYLSTT